MNPKGRYIVMGVSGCGKSTIGAALGARMNLEFLDGDTLHPATNIAKMTRGRPLDDLDRAPWLDAVADRLTSGAIVACSALKRAYRDRIRARASGPVNFIYLRGRPDTLCQRLRNRTGHFMPATMLASQLATLEEPTSEENVITIDIEQPQDRLVEQLCATLKSIGGKTSPS